MNGGNGSPRLEFEEEVGSLVGVVGVVALADETDELREVQVFVEAATDVVRTREEVAASVARWGLTGVRDIYVFSLVGAERTGQQRADERQRPDDAPLRPVIERVTAGWAGRGRLAQVVLSLRGTEGVGEVTGDRDILALAAEATLRAVDELAGRGARNELVAINHHVIDGRPTVSVLLRSADDELYVGSCLSGRHLPHECAVRATLHALNRRIAPRFTDSS